MENYVVRPKNASPLRGTNLIVQEIWVNPAEESCRIRLIGTGELDRQVALEVEEKLKLKKVVWEKEGQPLTFSSAPGKVEAPQVALSESEAWEKSIQVVTKDLPAVLFLAETSETRMAG